MRKIIFLSALSLSIPEAKDPNTSIFLMYGYIGGTADYYGGLLSNAITPDYSSQSSVPNQSVNGRLL